MGTVIILIAALLPAILLGLYIWTKDPHPEPMSWIIRAVLAGVIIVFPVVGIEHFLDTLIFGGIEPTTLIGTTIQAFCVAAIPEEGMKLLALWLLLRKNPQFDEHFDGIVYAVCVSLGFAAVENIGYVFGEGDNWLGTAIMRALLAVPGHYAFAILMGYYYSMYHFVDHSKATAFKIIAMPVLVHGIYDAIAMSGSVNPFIGSISFIVLIYFCIKLHRYAIERIRDMIDRNEAAQPAEPVNPVNPVPPVNNSLDDELKKL